MEDKDEKEPKKPEFIYIEDHRFEHAHAQYQGGHQEYFETIERLEKIKSPWFLCFLTLAMSMGLAVWTAILLFIYLGFFILNTITLRHFKNLQKSVDSYKKSLGKAVVFTLGCFVATFNLPFGFGIIILYFMILGERLNKDLMEKMTNLDL